MVQLYIANGKKDIEGKPVNIIAHVKRQSCNTLMYIRLQNARDLS
jgi:hypothetical protein